MASEYFNQETGEIKREPKFVKVYIEDLCAVKKLTANQGAIYNFMLQNMNWDNVVSYGKCTKGEFMKAIKIANQTFNNNISSLVDAGLIERMSRGEFRVNKKYAVKVEWSKVKSIRWTSKYTKSGKVETVEIK